MKTMTPCRLSALAIAGLLAGSAVLAQSPVTPSLETATTLKAIQNAEFAGKEFVLSDVATRVDAARAQLDQLRPPESATDEYNDAMEQVKVAEHALTTAIGTARQAPAEKWGQARLDLARTFTDYSSKVARAEEIGTRRPLEEPLPKQPQQSRQVQPQQT